MLYYTVGIDEKTWAMLTCLRPRSRVRSLISMARKPVKRTKRVVKTRIAMNMRIPTNFDRIPIV